MTFFTGGLPIRHEASSNSVTILTGTQALQVVHFDSRIVDFACLCHGAYPSGMSLRVLYFVTVQMALHPCACTSFEVYVL